MRSCWGDVASRKTKVSTIGLSEAPAKGTSNVDSGAESCNVLRSVRPPQTSTLCSRISGVRNTVPLIDTFDTEPETKAPILATVSEDQWPQSSGPDQPSIRAVPFLPLLKSRVCPAETRGI